MKISSSVPPRLPIRLYDVVYCDSEDENVDESKDQLIEISEVRGWCISRDVIELIEYM